MMKLLLFLGAMPLIPLALAHAPAPERPNGGRAADAVHCEIRVAAMPGGVRLEGAVLSSRTLAGSYAFQVDKRGSAGSSSSTQSGEFEVEAGAETVVGEVGIGLERGASYRAELTIRWPGGEAACVRNYPDRA